MPVLSLPVRSRTWVAAFVLGVLGAGGAPVGAETTVTKEYQVKAVFLFNFTQFVQWPSTAFAASDSPFCIGILGDDPFGSFLDETVQGEKVGGHPLVVQRFHTIGEAKNCQLLFISPSESGQLGAIFTGLKGLSILTVGDKEGFVHGGGMIRFVTVENKIHLRINPEAARSAGLTISSQILRLAEIVQLGKN